MVIQKLVCDRLVNDLLRNVNLTCNDTNLGYELIVDEFTLPLVSNALNLYDLFSEGACVVSLISNKRVAAPKRVAVYFLVPTESNVNLLNADFLKSGNEMYCYCHIFWSTTITTHANLVQLIARNSVLVQNIKSFVDLNLAFGAVDDYTINLGLKNLAFEIYDTFSNEKIDTNQNILNHLDPLIERFATVLISLKIKPMIRFSNNSSYSKLNSYIARQLEYFVHINYPESEQFRRNANVLIMDRTIDALVLFTHEYTYEALAYDLMGIKTNFFDANYNALDHDVFVFQHATKKKQVRYQLSPTVKLYSEIRFMHTTEAIKYMNDCLVLFLNTNEAARFKKQSVNTKLENVVSALPEYNDVAFHYYSLLHLANKMLEELKAEGIFTIGAVEQDIVTGLNSHGKPISALKALEDLSRIMAAKFQITDESKVRLILLYFYSFDGVKSSDRKQIINSAGLSADLINVLNYILDSKIGQTSEFTEGSIRHVHRLYKHIEELEHNKSLTKNAQYELSRFEPTIKEIASKLDNKTLSPVEFVFNSQRDKTESIRETPNNLDVNGDDWVWGNNKSDNVLQDQNINILFILGPVTHSEIRVVNNLSNIKKKPFLLVGTHVVSPSSYIEQIKKHCKQDEAREIS